MPTPTLTSPDTVRDPDHASNHYVDDSGIPAGADAAYTCDACGLTEEAADCKGLGERVLCYTCTTEAQARGARYARRRCPTRPSVDRVEVLTTGSYDHAHRTAAALCTTLGTCHAARVRLSTGDDTWAVQVKAPLRSLAMRALADGSGSGAYRAADRPAIASLATRRADLLGRRAPRFTHIVTLHPASPALAA